jgi:hypothetical protein
MDPTRERKRRNVSCLKIMVGFDENWCEAK